MPVAGRGANQTPRSCFFAGSKGIGASPDVRPYRQEHRGSVSRGSQGRRAPRGQAAWSGGGFDGSLWFGGRPLPLPGRGPAARFRGRKIIGA
jgi:hypothetical protein